MEESIENVLDQADQENEFSDLDFARKLGITNVAEGEELKEYIKEAIEDLNTWLEAKRNVKSDLKKMGVSESAPKGKLYAGKCTKTGEKIYK